MTEIETLQNEVRKLKDTLRDNAIKYSEVKTELRTLQEDIFHIKKKNIINEEFNEFIESTNQQYSNNLNSFKMFEAGYKAKQHSNIEDKDISFMIDGKKMAWNKTKTNEENI